MSKYMCLIRLIILSLFIFTQTQADTIYNLIKIPNLEIYDIKTTNKLRYLYAKKPFTLGTEKNIRCYNSKKDILEEQIEQEIKKAEEEIQNLKKGAPEKINKIANETSSELLKKLINTEVNNSSISAIVEDLLKKNGDKYYGN